MSQTRRDTPETPRHGLLWFVALWLLASAARHSSCCRFIFWSRQQSITRIDTFPGANASVPAATQDRPSVGGNCPSCRNTDNQSSRCHVFAIRLPRI